ncbi:hypothetical protein V8D89_002878 [Ganoderma adspersum]
MNPSTHSSTHTTTDAYSYTHTVASYGSTPSYLEYASGFHEDLSSWDEGWSGEHAGLGAWSDADQALFEALVTAEATNASPSGSRTLIPMPSPPSYSSELYLHASASSQSTIPPTFQQTPHETTASLDPPDLIYRPLHDAYAAEGDCFIAELSRFPLSDHCATHRNPSSFPYPSPSPGLSPQMTSIVIACQPRNMPVHPDNASMTLPIEQPPPEATMACISPDLIYPSARYGYNFDDDHSTAASSQPSRALPRATRCSASSAPYPTPSPSPSPRTSTIVVASQRRNAPARTAAPVASNTRQCPYCPYIQRNRRSPDLKRHVKTHTRRADIADWVCCGVPVVNAMERGVPAGTVQEAQVFEFDGMLMLGGCRKAFSRRDALKRHLRREKGKCFGDALSLHQRGNREGC